MNNCELLGIVANIYEETIEEIIQNSTLGVDPFTERLIEIDEEIAERGGNINNICWECDNCITFIENRKLLYDYLFGVGSVQLLIEMRQHIRRARSIDQVLQHEPEIKVSPTDFQRKPYITNRKQLVYLDHNVIDKFHKNEETRKRLTPGYAAIQYVYSPSHLEDLIRMKDAEQEQKVMNTIQTITDSLFISQYQGNELSLAYEDLKYSMQRVQKWNVAPDVETHREVTTDDRAIFFPERTDQNYTRLLTEKDVLKDSTIIDIVERYQRNMLDNENHVKNVSSLRQAVYALIQTMDLLGYKTDKGHTVKSGVHDIEHIIYAAGTDIFVTYDNKLKCRTELIYQMLGICTTVMNWKAYTEYVDALAKSSD